MCICAQRYFILVLLQKMGLLRQEKWETAVRADLPYFTPVSSSLLPPQFALHTCYELALQKQMVTGRK